MQFSPYVTEVFAYPRGGISFPLRRTVFGFNFIKAVFELGNQRKTAPPATTFGCLKVGKGRYEPVFPLSGIGLFNYLWR